MLVKAGLTIAGGLRVQEEITLPNPYTSNYTINSGLETQSSPVTVNANVTISISNNSTWGITP